MTCLLPDRVMDAVIGVTGLAILTLIAALVLAIIAIIQEHS